MGILAVLALIAYLISRESTASTKTGNNVQVSTQDLGSTGKVTTDVGQVVAVPAQPEYTLQDLQAAVDSGNGSVSPQIVQPAEVSAAPAPQPAAVTVIPPDAANEQVQPAAPVQLPIVTQSAALPADNPASQLAQQLSGVSVNVNGARVDFIDTSQPIYTEMCASSPTQAIVALPNGHTLGIGGSIANPAAAISQGQDLMASHPVDSPLYNHGEALIALATALDQAGGT